MAAYFHGIGSEIQSSADGMQTLYLMNPNNYIPYSDSTDHPASAPSNMFFLNPTFPAGNALNHSNDVSHAPPPSTHQPVFGTTLPAHMVGSSNTDEPSASSLLAHHEFSSGMQGLSGPRVQYHLWRPVNIDPTVSSTVGTATTNSCGANTGTVDVTSHHMGFCRPHPQGLSLSLSSQQTAYRSLSGEIDVPGHRRQFPALSPTNGGSGGDDIRVPGNSSASMSNGITDMQNVILRSKYLKAAQELLDEVVNVGEAINRGETEEGLKETKMNMDNDESKTAGTGDVSYSGASHENNSNSKQRALLTTAQRQELQMKKTKLVSMLDEVEQRYRQYRCQIQSVVSLFEQAAGLGAARTYTSLALMTISKQFRCLKDTISSQIKATSHSLGEYHCLGAKTEGSRLRFADHHLRQQRAMQQLGMNIHHIAWRPQRGLPERAVSVLRAWLFEHFLHPYPKDTDKVLLAKQTGLTRSQVSNWFINARVRLWKPMVEEMYMEETKEQEHKSSGRDKSSSKLKNSNKDFQSIDTDQSDAGREDQMKTVQSKPEVIPYQNVLSVAEMSISSMSTSPSGGCLQSHSGFNLLGFGDMQRSPHKTRNFEMQNSPNSKLSVDIEIKPGEKDHRDGSTVAEFGNHVDPQSKGGYSLIRDDPIQGGFPLEAYSMGDINGRFNSEDQLTPRFYGNGVSLTLGLPRSENLSLSGNQQGIGYLPLQTTMQLGKLGIGAAGKEFCAINTSQSSYSGNGVEHINIDIQNRKGFVAR